jgi:hypothetical protein
VQSLQSLPGVRRNARRADRAKEARHGRLPGQDWKKGGGGG